jgi:hypothetical protein
MAKENLVLDQLELSGFPFQLRIEHEVTQSHQQHGWNVESREQAWLTYSPTWKSGFIDLVLRHGRLVVLRLIIECKRQRANDARLLNWLFLVPEQDPKETEIVKCLTVEGWRRAPGDTFIDEKTGMQMSSWMALRIWDDIRVKPASYESQFCVMQGDQPKERPLLEKLCGELLSSVDGLVEEEIEFAKTDPTSRHICTFNIPVVVTNAQLHLCIFDAGAVSLQDGTVPPEQCRVERVPFVRFRKSLSAARPDEEERVRDPREANIARERTVFVVNSECLTHFLSGWDVRPFDQFDGYAVQQRMDRSSNRS